MSRQTSGRTRVWHFTDNAPILKHRIFLITMRTVTLLAIAALACYTATADVEFTRTIDSVSGAEGTLTLSSGCTASDQYGSNDCSLSWGEKVSVTVNATLDKDIPQGTTFSVDAKVDGLIPLKVNCPVCGGNCTVTIPIIKKTVTFAMPPCPIKANHIAMTKAITLPTKSPVPIKSGVKGTLTVGDLLKVEFTAKIGPNEENIAESVYRMLSYALN